MAPLPNFYPAVSAWFDAQFSAPSPPQAQGWPSIAEAQHTLIFAPTGSGKTLAAFLWCIDELFRIGTQASPKTFARNREGVHTLYISPLKALNNDIHRNLQQPLAGIAAAAKSLGIDAPQIRTLVRTGDTPSHVRQSMVRKPPHILITTPESLYLLLTSAQGREIFRQLKYIIVDEIHAMCNSKRGVHLSLSLERLMPLCDHKPVRIGLSATQRPLERIAAFLGGQEFDATTDQPVAREVNIVDCGRPKAMDLQVTSPVESFENLPDTTVWPAVIEQLYKFISQHRTTLVFVNMRAQTERIARQLNELHQRKTERDDAIIAQAHHGSISREARYDIEARLKNGEIPAVIATGSLELGIDIGSIDLVVHLQAPTSISSGLQRVGRSGHTLTATSKGRIIPLFRGDLDDAIAIAACMQRNEIEETTIPENCLDVLAQQIVAEVAQQAWSRLELYHLFRQSYCYRNLPLSLFDQVLNMLAGRFQETQIRALKPRVSWDKINDRLHDQRGSRLLAIMSGGTIPDSGNYTVYLSESNTRLGDLNEEFAFENRVGDSFYLGNNEWRIDRITHDRILVSPVAAVEPKPPFWKGGMLHRDYATSLKVAAFRREFLHQAESGVVETWLNKIAAVDAKTAVNLVAYFQSQIDHAGVVATDRDVLCEFYRDTTNEPHVALHAPFGGRVNGAWAIALAAALEKRFGAEVQYIYDDDGMLFRLLDIDEPPPFQELLQLRGDTLETLLIEALANSPTFFILFRHNAGRAMLLPRARQGKRIPLWLQRLRAADLLQVVQQYPDFPILIETYRECLHDVFDLSGLRDVSEKIRSGHIMLHFAHTSYPSPMISGLTFNFLANNLYESDRSRLPGQAAFVSSELLAEILNKEAIPAIVTVEIVTEAEAHWQYRSASTRARDLEQLFIVVERLGPLDDAALAERSAGKWPDWLHALERNGRIVCVDDRGWIATTEQKLFTQKPDLAATKKLIMRYLSTRGPRTETDIRQQTGLPAEFVREVLAEVVARKEIVSGQLLAGQQNQLYCERQNFAELYRRAISKRRQHDKPANRASFLKFLLHWHAISSNKSDLQTVLAKYAGYRMPLHFLEREIFATRVAGQFPAQFSEVREEFARLVQSGDIVIYGCQQSEESRRSIFYLPRQQGKLRSAAPAPDQAATDLSEPEKAVLQFLENNGASFGKDIVDGTGLSLLQVQNALTALANAELVTCDHYSVFLQTLQQLSASEPTAEPEPSSWQGGISGWRQRGRLRRPDRRHVEQRIRKSLSVREARWMLTGNFAIYGRDISEEQRAVRQARMLLQRYGIVVKEWYRHEKGLLPWPRLFYQLKRLEWQGEIYRGYFVEGLSGVQYALPEAVEWLKRFQRGEMPEPTATHLINATDPALPFGRNIDWDMQAANGEKIRISRTPSNHFLFEGHTPVAYLENFGTRIFPLAAFRSDHLAALTTYLKNWLNLPADLRPRKRIEIQQIDGSVASEHDSAPSFVQAGFEKEGEKLVLWPSRAAS